MDHPGWDDSWPLPTEHDIDDLIELGWVRPTAADRGKTRQFTLTLDGRMQGLRAERARQHPVSVPVSMEWTELEPVLQAAVRAFEDAGAPAMGVAIQSFVAPGQPRAAVAALTRAGLLIDDGGDNDQIEGPMFVIPSAEAFKLTRSWPSDAADAAIDRLVRVLLESAENTDDTDERSRLERVASWLGKFGSGVIQGTTSGVTTALITSGHVPK